MNKYVVSAALASGTGRQALFLFMCDSLLTYVIDAAPPSARKDEVVIWKTNRHQDSWQDCPFADRLRAWVYSDDRRAEDFDIQPAALWEMIWHAKERDLLTRILMAWQSGAPMSPLMNETEELLRCQP